MRHGAAQCGSLWAGVAVLVVACAAAAALPGPDFPAPPPGGAVAEIAQHPPTEIWAAWLDNGVRVVHRRSPADDGRVRVTLLLAGGELLESAATRGVSAAAAVAWSELGVESVPAEEARAWATGLDLRWRAEARPDALVLSLDAPTDALPEVLRLVYALLAAPELSPAAFEAWAQTRRVALGQRAGRSPAFEALVAGALFPPADARLRPIEPADFDRLSAPLATRWLRDASAAPLAVAIVGGAGPDTVYAHAAATLGGLPPRERIGHDTFAELRTLAPFRGPARVEHEDPRFAGALIMRGCIGADLGQLSDARRLRIASAILTARLVAGAERFGAASERLTVRSVEGAEYPGYGLFWIEAAVPADQADRALDAFDAELAAFAREGPTPDELARAQASVLAQIEQLVLSPEFWAERLSQLDYRGQSPKDLAELPTDYATMTPEAIAETLRTYDTEPRRITIILRGSEHTDSP